jgi:integrase/recombinase XerC
MALLDLQKLTAGLSRTWAGFLRDWDRSLRSGNYPETTRYNYLLAGAQLARYLGEYSPDPDADAAAADPCAVAKGHVEAFQAWMVQTRSASTALNKYKCLQQFFRWLQTDEQVIDRNPMDRVRPPKTPVKLVPVLREDDTAKVLQACRGKGFVSLRDEALIRLYANTGARLSEVGNLVAAENAVHAGQAACSYSWSTPPRRSRRWISRWTIRSGSVIGSGSGASGRAFAMP